MRLSRKLGLVGGTASHPLNLTSLFSDAVLLGYRGQTANVVTLSTADFGEGVYYLFVMRGTASNIFAVDGTTATRLAKEGSTNLALTFDSNIVSNSNSTYNGGVILAVRFPHYSDSNVRTLLGGISLTRKAARNSSSTASLSFAASEVDSDAVYLACFANASGSPMNGISFSSGNSIATPFQAWWDNNTTQGDTGTKDYAFVYTSGANVYLTLDGSNTGAVRNGSILELTAA